MHTDIPRDRDRALLIAFRVGFGELPHDDLEVGLGALDRLAFLQPSLDEHPALAAPLEPGVAGRRDDILDPGRLHLRDPGAEVSQISGWSIGISR